MTSNDLKGFSAKLLVATSASFESDRLIEFREKKHNDRSAKPLKKFQPNNTFTARKDFFPLLDKPTQNLLSHQLHNYSSRFYRHTIPRLERRQPVTAKYSFSL